MDLMRYREATTIRRATIGEWMRSQSASESDGGAGVIEVDGEDCYVEGDPMTIPDGTYYVHPDGGAWLRLRFAGGQIVDVGEESVQATHDAARDADAGRRPAESDVQVSRELAEAILAALYRDHYMDLDAEVDVEQYVVERSDD